MFAVIKTGGKQYKVAANDILKIEKLDATEGEIITFDQVLMVGDDADITIGAPLVEGALVAAEFVGTKKQKTVLIIKKHRRQHYDRRNGHRQQLSTVRITEILVGGAQPTLTAAPRRAPRIETLSDDATASGIPASLITDSIASPVAAPAQVESAAAMAGIETLNTVETTDTAAKPARKTKPAADAPASATPSTAE